MMKKKKKGTISPCAPGGSEGGGTEPAAGRVAGDRLLQAAGSRAEGGESSRSPRSPSSRSSRLEKVKSKEKKEKKKKKKKKKKKDDADTPCSRGGGRRRRPHHLQPGAGSTRARAPNAIGRAVDHRPGAADAWDDDDARENAAPRNGAGGEKEKAPPRFEKKDRRDSGLTKARDNAGGVAGKKGFKRRREYDDLDEDYDRGRLSKHQRRKAEGRTKSGAGPRSRLRGKTTGLFDSAAKLKKEIAEMEKFGERLDEASRGRR